MTTPINRLLVAFVAFYGIHICLAQLPTDALTNEAETTEPVRVEGTLARPQSPYDNGALAAAWTNYRVALTAASRDVRDSIRELFDSATAQGDLDEAVKWQAVAEKFSVAGVLPRQPELKAAVVTMESQFKDAEEGLLAAYTDMIKSLTMEGKIDDAQVVRDEREEVLKARVVVRSSDMLRQGSAGPRKTSTSRPTQADGWEDITRDMLGGTRKGNLIVLLPNGERAIALKPYAPPVEIEYVCATRKNNIRLSFSCWELIFNWELNQSELRIEGGPAAGQHLPNAGAIPPGQMVTIRQVVRPNGMTLFVDGRMRASWKGDFSQVRDLIEIFGTDSEIQLKSVRVRKPPE